MKVKSLLRLLWIVLLSPCLAQTEPSEEPQSLTSSQIQELLTKADKWQIPHPPEDARLHKIWAYESHSPGFENNGLGTDFYQLAFIAPKHPTEAIIGLGQKSLEDYPDRWIIPVPDIANLDLKDVASASPFTAYASNSGLVTGIQLIRLGFPEKGQQLIQVSLGEDSGHRRSAFHSPASEGPTLMLARTCLGHQISLITSAKPDFPAIEKTIQLLVTDQPELKDKSTDWALEALAVTNVHPPAQPGTTEALIQDYLLSGGTEGGMATSRDADDFSPAERQLVLTGFEAVPSLIEQLDSKRLTNHLMQGFNNFSSYPMNAGAVIDAYLSRLANTDFDSNWLNRQKGWSASKDSITQWWEEASQLGEEQYVAQNTITKRKDKHSLSHELLFLASQKYPHLLPELYQEIQSTDLYGWPIAHALVEADSIPLEKRCALFKEVIAKNRQSQRNSALTQLLKLDPKEGDQALLKLITNSPKTAEEKYWIDMDAGLGRYVSKSKSPQVWQALLELLERADLGMRMELVDHLRPPHDAPEPILALFHSIFEKYKDDPIVRDETSSSKFDGPGAGFPYTRLAMQDFIHLQWASWHKLEIPTPEKPATSDDWKNYRQKVTAALP